MGDRHSAEIGATTTGLVMAAGAAGPGAVFGMAFLITSAAVALFVGKLAYDTSASWVPVAVLLAGLAGAWACHRKLWRPIMPRTAARVLTGVLAAGMLMTYEAGTAVGGIALGRATGFNPEAALMDAGFRLTGAMEQRIETERERVTRTGKCGEHKASGKLFAGTVESVNLAAWCSGYLPVADIRQACGEFTARNGRRDKAYDDFFCRELRFGKPTYR